MKRFKISHQKRQKRSSLVVYFILRVLVILCMLLQIMRGDLNNVMLCLLSLFLLFLPLFIQDKFKITLPTGFEITIFLFIFSAEILGEINNFFGIIPFWDNILHTINGFLAAAVGFSLIDLLNKKSKYLQLSPFYVCLVAFCFSMTIGAMWELFEYSCDKFLLKDMQKDEIVNIISSVTMDRDKNNKAIVINDIDRTVLYDKNGVVLATINGGYLDIGINDTMKDLLVNLIGATVFSIIGYFTLVKKEDSVIIKNFVPKKGKRISN